MHTEGDEDVKTSHLKLSKKTENGEERKEFRDLIKHYASEFESTVDGLPNKYDMEFVHARSRSYSLSHCHKSRHHRNIIPLSQLALEHLPLGYRDDKLLKYINCFAKFSVKITVHTTTRQRNESEKYYLPVPDNSNIVRQGSGWLGQVHDDDVSERTPCSCSNCRHGDSPHDVIGPIYVMTARHLVYDESEALSTEIRFTDDKYDDETFTDDSFYLWTAQGYDVAHTPDVDRDLVFMKCYSHQLNIVSHLKSITRAFLKATMTLEKFNIENTPHQPGIFLISYPHGRGKHVSFGTVKDQEEIDVEFDPKTGEKIRGRLRYWYDVPTCPGSSGAAVCNMGTNGAYHYQFPHSLDLENRCGSNSGLVDWFDD